MRQTSIPNVNVPSQAGLCQKYVNDAGGIPNTNPPRSGTAKAAFLKEQSAGKIRTDQLPDNVWVIVWFAFTKGSYTYPDGSIVYYKDAWHVAWSKRNGSTTEIHDSEVHRGARPPYTSIAAVEAWFAAYGAKFAGWSTDCDGRNYAKEEDEVPTITKEYLDVLTNAYFMRDANDEERSRYVGKADDRRVMDDFNGSPERKQVINTWEKGKASNGDVQTLEPGVYKVG